MSTPTCLDAGSHCLWHYRKGLLQWIRSTSEFLPPSEQALQAREQWKVKAEQEFEEVSDDREGP